MFSEYMLTLKLISFTGCIKTIYLMFSDVVKTNCNNDNKITNKTQDCPFSLS